MGNFEVVIEALVRDTREVFDRVPPRDASRPKGILIIGGVAHRDEVLAAFRRCPYFVESNIPIACVDSAPERAEGIYWVELDYFFR
ncbi:MAG: hypothetical protein AABY16_02230 [Nanoarchaeota archaeon]